MSSSQLEIVYPATALLCGAVGSVYDVRERRIPNLLSASSIVGGLLLHGFFDGWVGARSAALAGLIAFVAFLVFYLAGGMGAGDVKLMTAVGCLAGLSTIGLVLIATALSGAIFALVLAVKRRQLRQTLTNVAAIVAHHGEAGLTPHPDLNLANTQTLRLPFALPIAAGCFVATCTALWGGPR